MIASIVCLLVGVAIGWLFCRQTRLKHLHKDLLAMAADMNQTAMRRKKQYDPDAAQQIDRYRTQINDLVAVSRRRLV